MPAVVDSDQPRPVAELLAQHPGLADLGFSSHRETAVAESVVVHALVEFFNHAHLDVLRRVHAILFEGDTTESGSNRAG